MAFSFGIGDVIGATKLAWHLYHDLYLVASEAPEEFRQLVNELASLQGVLRTLRDDMGSDEMFMKRIGEARKETLGRCLAGCYETLERLNKLVLKYQKLGIGNGLQFWQRIKWVTQMREVSTLRAKVMVHSCNLSLCMSSIGKYETGADSSLTRIETSMIHALERQQLGQEASADTEEVDSFATLESNTVTGSNGIERRLTNATLVDDERAFAASPDSQPSNSIESFSSPPQDIGEGVDAASPLRGIPKSPRASSISTRDTRKGLGSNESNPLPPSPSAGGVETDSNALNKPNGVARKRSDGEVPDVLDVVADAMKQLNRIRSLEQSSRPLRTVPQDGTHRPDEALRARFQELANDELKIRRLNARDWLRVATWWLLKARGSMETEQPVPPTNARGSVSPSNDSRSIYNQAQAYVDLLKASWILYDVILKEENLTPLLTDENRKLFYNLSDAINEDFFSFRDVDVPDKQTIHRHNLNIWELLQPEEEKVGEEDDYLPGLENGRWITVEQEDAGREDEKVLYRTFVNAEIGSKALRMKSRGAPYMLLLSVKEGESEPKVTLCNQSGTFSMTRDFEPQDLVQEEHLSPDSPLVPEMPALFTRSTQPIPLEFKKMKVSVTFQTDAVLPLSRVQVSRDNESKQVIAKWSDCSHEVADRTDGNYNKIYSYTYDPRNPNVAVNLVFPTNQQAADFQNSVLRLNFDPVFSWTSGIEEHFVYDISDNEPTPKSYKAILISRTRNGSKYSELFYSEWLLDLQSESTSQLFSVYRDTDYRYCRKELRVHFPQVYYTDYISNHVDKLYQPPVDSRPCFSHTAKKLTNSPIEFDDEGTSQGFMRSLTLNQELLFSRQVHFISTKAPSRFGSSKSSKGLAEVQLWKRGNTVRLVSRWDDKVDDKWLTMTVPPGSSGIGVKDSNRAALPKVEYERGRLIDMANLVARSPREGTSTKKVGPITIAFDSVKDREEFGDALEAAGSLPRRGTNDNIQDYIRGLNT
ncbi:MAG: hypothetical protein M1833_003525 [Piccolia ochrophora]|nr:MAG: hypothetical protein M1833_003525 [Piccolia ochrophora]